VHWELMFTRSLFKTGNLSRQHDLLRRVAALVDDGALISTMTSRIAGINANHLKQAHVLIEQGGTRGKIVLEGF
jgi:NADPH:quinone reductase-like Zn-dependent oxidoreductase